MVKCHHEERTNPMDKRIAAANIASLYRFVVDSAGDLIALRRPIALHENNRHRDALDSIVESSLTAILGDDTFRSIKDDIIKRTPKTDWRAQSSYELSSIAFDADMQNKLAEAGLVFPGSRQRVQSHVARIS